MYKSLYISYEQRLFLKFQGINYSKYTSYLLKDQDKVALNGYILAKIGIFKISTIAIFLTPTFLVVGSFWTLDKGFAI